MLYKLAPTTLLLISLVSCQTPPFHQADLTNNGQGKYWDIVYSTDIHGHINPSYPAPHPTLHDRQVGGFFRCDYFAQDSSSMGYDNLDSVTVRGRGAGTDFAYSPGTFRLTDSILFFGGHRHKVLALTPALMVLEYEVDQQKAIDIYLPSRCQTKKVLQ